MRTESDAKMQLALFWNEDFRFGYRIEFVEEREKALSIATDELRKRGLPETDIKDISQSVREACDPNDALKKMTEKALRKYHAFVRERWYKKNNAEQFESGYEEGDAIRFELLGRLEERNRIANNMRKAGLSEEMIACAIAAL